MIHPRLDSAYAYWRLVLVLILVSVLSPLPAHAFESGGLADPGCFYFYMNGVKPTSVKASSKTNRQYSLNATGRAGMTSCTGTLPFVGPYPVTIIGLWDAASGRASEQIYQGTPGSKNYIVTHTHATCSDDPWVKPVTCTPAGQSNTHPGSALDGYSFEGPFPVSATLLSSAQRKVLADMTPPFTDFSLPPNTPPVIASPGGDSIYRNGAPVMIQIKRPADGNDRWYDEHKPLQFEVQFDVNQEARAESDKLAKSFGPMWSRIPAAALVGSDTLSTTPVTVPLATFAARGPGGSGTWQTWRLRARVRDTTASRPWSAWQVFYVVAPISYTKLPDKGGSLPAAGSAASKKPKPAPTDGAPAIHPAPIQRALPVMPVR